MAKHTRGQESHLGNETKTSVPALIQIESSDLCEYTRACLNPILKLQLDCFYSNLSKCGTRVNETQSSNLL